MKKNIQQDHYIMAFIKNNLFPLIGLVGAVVTLWGMTQTLPLKSDIRSNKEQLVHVARALEINEVDHEKFATDEKVDALIEALQQRDDDIFKLLDSIARNQVK